MQVALVHLETVVRRSFEAVVLTLAALCIASSAWAARAYEPAMAYERDHSTYLVDANGSYQVTRETIVRIQTAAGIDSEGVQAVYFSASRHEVLSILAWTIQPDGERIPVSQEAIHTRDDLSDRSARSFSDTRQKAIIFPKVRVGSRLHYIVVIRCHTPQFPGQFMAQHGFSRLLAEDDFQLDLDLPADKPIYVESRGVSERVVDAGEGRKRHRFTYRRASTQEVSRDRVDEFDVADLLRISTIPDPIAYGALYQSRAVPMARVTEPIRLKALELTRNMPDVRSKVRALHHWVASNIRYIAVSIEDGGFVPRSAEQVLANLYGDCKDHVVLLEALLAAVGIDSSPALINSGKAYSLSSIGIGGPLNHVITYVPALDLYIDSTDPMSPFGTLPFEVMDKPVLLTALNRTGRTPAMKAAEHVTENRLEMTVRNDGTITGKGHATLTGVMQIRSRSARADSLSEPEEEVVRQLLERFGESGTGSIEHSDPRNLDEPYRLSSTFLLDPVANVPGPAGMMIPIGLSSGKLQALASYKLSAKYLGPFVCESETVREQYTLRFARSIRILSVPTDVRHADANFIYRASYRRTGQTVTALRELVVQFPGSVCQAPEHARWATFLGRLNRDLRSQVVYR
jgi:hypothetical protein